MNSPHGSPSPVLAPSSPLVLPYFKALRPISRAPMLSVALYLLCARFQSHCHPGLHSSLPNASLIMPPPFLEPSTVPYCLLDKIFSLIHPVSCDLGPSPSPTISQVLPPPPTPSLSHTELQNMQFPRNTSLFHAFASETPSVASVFLLLSRKTTTAFSETLLGNPSFSYPTESTYNT